MGFWANQLSVLFSLIGIHSIQSWIAIARHGVNKTPRTLWVDKCLKIPLNCFILLFKILMAFFIQGPDQVLLNSGSPPLMENPAEWSKLRPISRDCSRKLFWVVIPYVWEWVASVAQCTGSCESPGNVQMHNSGRVYWQSTGNHNILSVFKVSYWRFLDFCDHLS